MCSSLVCPWSRREVYWSTVLTQETASPWCYTTLFMGLQHNGTIRIPRIHPAGSASGEGNRFCSSWAHSWEERRKLWYSEILSTQNLGFVLFWSPYRYWRLRQKKIWSPLLLENTCSFSHPSQLHQRAQLVEYSFWRKCKPEVVNSK